MKTVDISKDSESDFFTLFGSWQSDKSGTEINNEIYSARNDQPNNIQL